jgi:hypothetical protein
VQVSFKRWLGVEQSQFDRATVQAWDGAAWQTVWTNPNVDLNDTAWQSVSYDVSPYAGGPLGFPGPLRADVRPAVIFCGWNIDDLTITNGYVPQNCEAGSCSAGCTPVAQISGLSVAQPGNATTLTWAPARARVTT